MNEITKTKEKALTLADLPTLPIQVLQHFPNATEEEKIKLAMTYSGPKKNPTFAEWLESYQQSELFSLTQRGTEWVKDLQKKLNKYLKQFEKEKHLLNEEEIKKRNKEIKRQLGMINNIGGQHLDFTKELNKIVQNNLNREAPKKLEVTQHKVTPGDVANLINEARKVVDVNATTKEEK